MNKISDIYQKHLAEVQALHQATIDREIADLEAQLATLATKRDRHNAECEHSSGFVTNPAGEIGGIRSRSPKRKQQMFDRWTRQARTATDLFQQYKRIQREIKAKQAYISRRATEAARDEILRLVLRPGDRVSVPWSDDGIVVRVNQKSVTVKTGTVQECVKWSLIGLHDWRELAEERLVQGSKDSICAIIKK